MGLIESQTKITIPGRRKDWLSRGRLLDLLNRLSDLKLVLIAAPAGYGKTALLVDFASQADVPICWLGLDALDRDPRRFLTLFIASIRRHYPTFGQETLAILTSDPAAPINREIITTLLANEVTTAIREDFIIILDDLHLVEEGEDIIPILNGFIERVGENCHILLASRTLPSLPCLPRMAASMQVGGISFEELSFHPEEIQALLLLNSGIHIPYSEAEELAEESEGWITGLNLSFRTSPVGGADQLRLARVSGVGLYEYLAQQVLDIQPVDIRTFLLRSSYLEEFDAALCEGVFGVGEDWAGLISRTVQANLFILTFGDDVRWYRYNPLFQRFLQETLARESPEEVAILLDDLGKVYRSQYNWEKAYGVYQSLGDPGSLADLIEEAYPSLARDGHLITLSSWLDALPTSLIRQRPTLASLRGIVGVMLGDVELGLELLDFAADRFRQESESANLAITLTRRTLGRIFRGDFPGALDDAKEAYQLSASSSELLEVQADALRSKGISLINLDRSLEANKSLTDALQLYTRLEDASKGALIHIDLGYSNSILGRYSEALRHYELALQHWEKKENLVHQATVLNNIGVLLHIRGEILPACQRFEEALIKSRRSGYRRAESLTLASLGDVYSDLDDLDAALDAYQQARDIAYQGELKSLILYLDLAETIVAFRKGDEYLAYELLALAQKRVKISESDYEHGLYGFRAGQINLLNQDYAEAISELTQAVQFFIRGGRQAELAQVYLLLAEAYFQSKKLAIALEYVERALETAAGLESEYVLLTIGRLAKGILGEVGQHAASQDKIPRLLRKVKQHEEDLGGYRRALRHQVTLIPVSPPQISVKALGDGVVIRDGKLIDRAGWQTQIARDMFYCLLAHPDGLTKERLGVIFWPETPSKQMRVSFKNTIYRLRLTLGSEVVSYEMGRYKFNAHLDYWYDVKDFLAILAEDEPTTEIQMRILHLQRAVSLYEGHYLPDMDHTWVAVERERLRQAFFSAGITLGKLHLDMGDFEAALNPGLHLLMMDTCFEGAHRLIMRAHAGMGNRAAALRQFNRCRDALWQEFRALPSAQTLLLYEELTA